MVKGELRGVVPSFEIPSLIGRDITQPFCEYGYPLLDDGVDLVKVISVLSQNRSLFDARIIKEAGWRSSRGYSTAGYGGVDTGVTFRLPLAKPFDYIRSQIFETEVRRSIRIAQDSGLEIREGDSSEYYPLYVQTMERLGSPQFPRPFLRALKEEFESDCTILLAERRNDIVAGILMLSSRNESIVWSNGSDARAWEHKPNYLLYVNAIRRAISNGKTVIDFGRTEPGAGVYRFKRQFGGDEYPLTNMVFPPHRVDRGLIRQYRHLKPIMKHLSPVITHRYIGPKLKEWIHE